MKSAILASVIVAAGLAQANPTKTTPQQPHKRSDLPTVTTSGNAFWAGGERFYIRGIDYQPGGSSANIDPLADTSVCLRDLEKFKDLGVNTIRVYSTDNSANHDDCMNAYADAGIYVVLDANNPLYSINRANPAPSYNSKYLQSVFATIDEFVKYPNTLAFFSGNEVINDEVNTTLAAPYVKATTRDMRQYIRERGHRAVPVGYSAADVADNRMQTAEYFNCGTEDERSDFFAFNDYSWCNSDFVTSGWDVKVKNFTGYGIPIFLSEYGCNTNTRQFGEVAALMNDEMTGVYSGGLMYEYSMEESKFGIVQINGNNVEELPEYANFKKALSDNPAPTGAGGAASASASVDCPAADANWLVTQALLPAIPTQALRFMTEGAGQGPGLNGEGSQDAGAESTGLATAGSGATDATPTGSASAAVSHQGPMNKAPLVVSGLVVSLSLLGTLLL